MKVTSGRNWRRMSQVQATIQRSTCGHCMKCFLPPSSQPSPSRSVWLSMMRMTSSLLPARRKLLASVSPGRGIQYSSMR